jgi:hypothetical protein
MGSVADPGCLSRIRPFFDIPDPDPTNKKKNNKLTFFMQEQVIIEVIFKTKFNFSWFSPVFKVKY